MKTLVRSAVLGAAFGLAASCFQTWMGVQKMISLRMPPTPGIILKAAVLEVALGVVLGMLLVPLLRLPRGGLWHVLALAALWLTLERLVAPDPGIVAAWMAPPAVALVLLGLGRLAALRYPTAPWMTGALAIIAAVVAPIAVYSGRSIPRDVPAVSAGEARPDAPDVVVVVLDTVRALNVSAYGYGRPTTPYLEKLAAESGLFVDATSPSTWSLPSHASLFTGRFPSDHGAHGEHRVLAQTVPTLAEVLARNGYETRCFTANPHISAGFGLTRGFGWSDQAWMAATGGRSFIFVYRVLDLLGISAPDKGGSEVAKNFEWWVASRGLSPRPAFAFVNFLEAHFPYHQVPAEYLKRFSERSRPELRAISLKVFGAQFGRRLSREDVQSAVTPSVDMYDAGVLYTDYLLQRIVESLRNAGTLDRTILVVLSDHGEMIGEHGDFGHGAALYEPDVRVPLLVRFPARVPPGSRAEAPVSTLGVYATVLELAGIEPPEQPHVGSLLPALRGLPAGAPVIVERFTVEGLEGGNAPLAMRDRRYRTYRSGSMKLVVTSRSETFLFDLARDPAEAHDLAAGEIRQVERLREELAGWEAALDLPPIDAALDFDEGVPNMDPAVRERLEALGYTAN